MKTLSILLKILSAASLLAGLLTFVLDLYKVKLNQIPPRYMKLFGVGLVLLAIVIGLIDFFASKQPIDDPPDVRQKKVKRIKQVIADEILANISSLNARLGFVEQSMNLDGEFTGKLRAVRQRVAPSLEQVAETGYGQLIDGQRAAFLRQSFDSKPLRIEFGGSFIHLLIESKVESEIDISAIRFFYDKLAETQWASESFISSFLSDSDSKRVADNPDWLKYKKRRIALDVDVLRNRSIIAHIAGLKALHNLDLKIPDLDNRLAELVYLEPRHEIDDRDAQNLLSERISKVEKLLLERKSLVEEANRLLDQDIKAYMEINERLIIRPTDSPAEVIGKAVSLRQLGRPNEALTAFSRYSEMFAATDPTARLYTQIAKQFTLQIQDLGVKGGVFICELKGDGAASQAGLKAGDIIISYGDKVISNKDDLLSALQNASSGKQQKVYYLRLDEAGHFIRQTTSIASGPLGISFWLI